MNDVPTAIETVYRGFRFRSRLEARWAVFFDAMGVKYEYELEGFELPGNRRYLPDFKLTSILHCWFEVKPGVPNRRESMKAALLASETKHPVLVAEGSPWPDTKIWGFLKDSIVSKSCPYAPLEKWFLQPQWLWDACTQARSKRFEERDVGPFQ